MIPDSSQLSRRAIWRQAARRRWWAFAGVGMLAVLIAATAQAVTGPARPIALVLEIGGLLGLVGRLAFDWQQAALRAQEWRSIGREGLELARHLRRELPGLSAERPASPAGGALRRTLTRYDLQIARLEATMGGDAPRAGTMERVAHAHLLLKQGLSRNKAFRRAHTDSRTYDQWCERATGEAPLEPYRVRRVT